jgi:hypothetical protein
MGGCGVISSLFWVRLRFTWLALEKERHSLLEQNDQVSRPGLWPSDPGSSAVMVAGMMNFLLIREHGKVYLESLYWQGISNREQ